VGAFEDLLNAPKQTLGKGWGEGKYNHRLIEDTIMCAAGLNDVFHILSGVTLTMGLLYYFVLCNLDRSVSKTPPVFSSTVPS
jgi:hypothetical protein